MVADKKNKRIFVTARPGVCPLEQPAICVIHWRAWPRMAVEYGEPLDSKHA